MKAVSLATGRDVRLPVAGTMLRRQFKDTKIEVKVLEEGFEYQGRAYRSLSAIASEIAGTRWNGFVFFAGSLMPRASQNE